MNIQVRPNEGSKRSSANLEVTWNSNQKDQTPHNSPRWLNSPFAVKNFHDYVLINTQITGLNTLMAQDPDHVTPIKKEDMKLKSKSNLKPNNINL